ncbi:DgyrCDS9360 [Dimorphilus gyrociliatus]|uniref:DgyrCDS9360 n=1 Tax=Dimorphilus gyrociliatus TaxID=2664684 RepID=A0A7I8VZF0_9ANNE|nr:DgyrCDS9360 [Dimorphilus gyrociliatus]
MPRIFTGSFLRSTALITAVVFSIYLFMSLFDDGQRHQQLSLARLRYKVPIVKYSRQHKNRTFDRSKFKFVSLYGALRARATVHKKVTIALFNHSTVEQAVNYALHAQNAKFSSYFLMAEHKKDCDSLWSIKRDIPCLPCKIPKVDSRYLSFNNCAFYSASKSIGQTYSVMISLVDSLILRHPHLPSKNFDLGLNYGSNDFIPISLYSSQKVVTLLKQVGALSKKMSRENALREVLKTHKRKYKIYKLDDILPTLDCNLTRGFQLKKSWNGFLWGNNCPKDSESRIYILKELKKWSVNTRGYYTNEAAKYLVISSEINNKNSLKHLENAIQLANITKRILILPKFSCNCRSSICLPGCSLWHIFHTKNLHIRKLAHNFSYRESSFFENSLIPRKLRLLFEKAPIHKVRRFMDISHVLKLLQSNPKQQVIKLSGLDKISPKLKVIDVKSHQKFKNTF